MPLAQGVELCLIALWLSCAVGEPDDIREYFARATSYVRTHRELWTMGLKPRRVCVLLVSLCVSFCALPFQARGGSNPVPQVNPIVPSSVAPGGPAFSITLIGTGFVSTSVVNWNGGALTTHFVSATKLTADVPAANIASPGSAWITVTNPAPGGGTSLPAFLRIAAPTSSPSFVSYAQSTIFGGQGIGVPFIGDFNNDGKLDLAFGADTATDLVEADQKLFACIELGNGDGSFQSPACTPGNVSAIGDFNGDGKLDVVALNYNDGTNSVSVYLGNGDGTLQSPIKSPAGTGPLSVNVGDVNGDGKLDLIVRNQPLSGGNNFISILIGNGDGTFQAPVQYSPSPATFLQSMLVGDFNRDGNIDIVFTDGGSQHPAIYFAAGNGDGSFQPAVVAHALTPNEPTNLVTAADLHGTGTLDLVGTENPPNDSLNAIFSGNGDGTFQAPVEYSFGNIFGDNGAAVDDVNADGKLDLVIFQGATTAPPPTPSYISTVGYQLGNGNGTFQTPVDLTTPTPPPISVGVVTGDFNGDGKVDMAVVLYDNSGPPYEASLQIYLQGAVPVITVSPAALAFTGQAVNTTSPAQIIKVANTGTTALTVSGATISGANANQFGQTSTCGATLAAGASCQVSVTFAPTSVGTFTASVSIADSAIGTPQTVALSGSTSGAGGAVSPISIAFASQYVGTTGLPQTVTVTNGGNTTLTISNVAANPNDFGVLNSCGSSLAAGASCSIGVFFDPTTSGTRTGTLTIADNAVGSPFTVALSGKGEDFSLAAGSSSATVSAGQTANYTLSVAPVGGFAQSVALTCGGGPAASTCTVSPSTISLSGAAAKTAMVTVTTVSQGLTLPFGSGWPTATRYRLPPLTLELAGTLLLMVLAMLLLRERLRWAPVFALAVVVCLGMTLTSCGGGSGGGGGTNPQAGTYTVTVTGNFTSGSTTLTHAAKLTLVVQ